MSQLQFTTLDDAFSPISQKKKRERKPPEIQEELPEHQVVVPPNQYTITQPAPIAPPRLADEIFAMQPYFNNLFMIFVLGMLYDMRQAALDIKAHLITRSS